MDDYRRKIYISAAAAASYETLSPEFKNKVNRAINLLKYPPSSRPIKLLVLKSKLRKGKFIVKVSSTLRILYHMISKHELYIDLIYRRRSSSPFLPNRGAQ